MNNLTIREKENRLMQWWVERMPQTKEIFDNCVKYYEEDENIGLYNFIGDLVVVIYDRALEKHDDKTISEFFCVYNDCVNEFKGQFLYNNSEDVLITIAYTEIFEGTTPKDYKYILKLMPEGVLKDEFKRFAKKV